MKFFLIILVCLLSSPSLFAQRVQSYNAVVKTKNTGTEKGILYHVTDKGIILQTGDSVVAISVADIKRIKIFTTNKPYKYKKVFTYDPWAESNYEILPHSQVKVRKWGMEDPSLGEEIGGHVATAAINGAINLITAPLSKINGNIFNAFINHDNTKFTRVKNDLYYYSIYYQMNDYKEALKKIRIAAQKNQTP